MWVLALMLILVLLLIAIISLASWGTMTAATAFTLSATIASMQNTLALLTCALIASLPLLVFGALRLGILLGERHKLNVHTKECRQPSVTILSGVRPSLPTSVPTEQEDTLALPAPYSEPQPFLPSTPHRVKRMARTRNVRYATRLAKRWFS